MLRIHTESTVTKTTTLFSAFWRWHFYASLIVIPALFVLGVSGLLMLYKAQLDPIFTRE